MNGITVETVASSWIDALGGLSQMYIRMVPPCFSPAATAGEGRWHANRSAATKPSLGSMGHLPACARRFFDGRTSAAFIVRGHATSPHGRDQCAKSLKTGNLSQASPAGG